VSRFSVELLPEAEAEVRETFFWYFERSPLAADAFRTEVFDAMDRLAEHADMWAPDEDGLRRYLLSHFPYAVHYELLGQRAIVFAVGHQRRVPQYWKQR
jgi:plasmid stabilization system protein ParE